MLQIFCFGCYGRVRAATERNAVYTDHDDTVLPNVHWRVPHRILTISTMSRLNEFVQSTHSADRKNAMGHTPMNIGQHCIIMIRVYGIALSGCSYTTVTTKAEDLQHA